MRQNKIDREAKEVRKLYRQYLEMFEDFKSTYEKVWRGNYLLIAKVNPLYKNHPLYNDAKQIANLLYPVYLGRSKEFNKYNINHLFSIGRFKFEKLTPKQQREFFLNGWFGYSIVAYKKMFIPTVIKYKEIIRVPYQSIPGYTKIMNRLFRDGLWRKYIDESPKDKQDDKGRKKREQRLIQQQIQDGFDYLFGG